MSEEMKLYIGAKIIGARPMDELTFLKNWKNARLQGKENRQGYLVEYPDGYVSWSPKGTFEDAYRLITGAEKILMKNY